MTRFGKGASNPAETYAETVSNIVDVAYIYPAPYWRLSEHDWIKSLLLFFDVVAILLPDYMYGRHHVADPSLAEPLEERGMLRVHEPNDWIDDQARVDLVQSKTGHECFNGAAAPSSARTWAPLDPGSLERHGRPPLATLSVWCSVPARFSLASAARGPKTSTRTPTSSRHRASSDSQRHAQFVGFTLSSLDLAMENPFQSYQASPECAQTPVSYTASMFGVGPGSTRWSRHNPRKVSPGSGRRFQTAVVIV